MKKMSAGSALLALSIGLASPVMAQDSHQNFRGGHGNAQRNVEQQRVFTQRDDRHARQVDRREDRADRRDNRRDNRLERRDDRRDNRLERRDDHRDARADWRHDAHGRPFYATPRYQPAPPAVYRGQNGWRGAGPNHDFYRGGRLPTHYRSHTYVVNNWHAHRLSAPPRGYHWVQTGPDYVLAAIATGVILQVLLGG